MASIWKGAVTFGLVNIPVHRESAVRKGKFLVITDADLESAPRSAAASERKPARRSRQRQSA